MLQTVSRRLEWNVVQKQAGSEAKHCNRNCWNTLFVYDSHIATQLAMRSLRLEHFSTSVVVLHTCGPTQTVDTYVPYRWSIQYFFVLRGANKMDYVLFKTIHRHN